MINSKRNLMFVAVLAVILAAAIGMGASADGVPPGASGEGDVPLGDGGTDEDGLSIDTPPAGSEIFLISGDTTTSYDSIIIFSPSGGWKLTVEDANADTSSHDGKMRQGSMSGDPPVWNYDDQKAALTQNFAVLVDNIGNNGESGSKFDTLNDATDLSSPVDIVIDDTSGSISLDLRYSQEAVEGDAIGDYRIDLKYTLSSNP